MADSKNNLIKIFALFLPFIVSYSSACYASWLEKLATEAQSIAINVQKSATDSAESATDNSPTSEQTTEISEIIEQWKYVTTPDSGATFFQIKDFVTLHPNWPDQEKILIRAERAIRNGEISDDEIISWFTKYPPISGIGKASYAEALSRKVSDKNNSNKNNELLKKMVLEAWRDADLSPDEENIFLANFSNIITARDHFLRADRLLWEEKITVANRIITKLPVAEQILFQARIAYMKDAKNADYLASQITSSLKNNSGLIYEKLRNRARRNDKNAIRDILLHAPSVIVHPNRWWKLRESEIRRAVKENNYKMALKLLANHGQEDGETLAEALWLEGWLSLRFSNDAQRAYRAFYHMHYSVKTPVSKSRAAYWAGRAAEAMNDHETAKSWFETAAANLTTFYGQLSANKISETAKLTLPDEPAISFFDYDPIFSDHIKEAISISIKNGEHKTALRFIQHVIKQAKNEHSILSAAALGHELNAPHISVKAAKKAQAQGIILKNVGYPLPATEENLPIERALALAIIRQESEFDTNAESPAGAVGMMQLLPSTAKETARKIGEDFSNERLSEHEYNIRLGSSYLARLINAYDGSYLLAIAAYNAGPGNVQKWLKEFGMPAQNDLNSAIDWLEKIPFYETRNYVQRVMENLQVYRALEGQDTIAINSYLMNATHFQ